jgi:hypothetical protein
MLEKLYVVAMTSLAMIKESKRFSVQRGRPPVACLTSSAALKLLSKQSSCFLPFIAKGAEEQVVRLVPLINHVNRDIRNAAFPALDSWIETVDFLAIVFD